MEIEKHLQLMQRIYAGMLADTVLQFSKEGVLDSVRERKRNEQLESGKQKAAQFGISKPEEVFTTLSQLFGCANWKIGPKEQGFIAEATNCMLCGIAKKLNASSPCNLYCLDPMEGMVKGLTSNTKFKVLSTLWNEKSCKVEIVF